MNIFREGRHERPSSNLYKRSDSEAEAYREQVVRTGANGLGIRGAEYAVLVPVCQIPSLFEERRGKAPRESGIVNRLHQNVVKDLGSSHPVRHTIPGLPGNMAHVPLSRVLTKVPFHAYSRRGVPCSQIPQTSRQDTE